MKFNYCPKCGKQDTITQKTVTKYQCSNCDFIFWNNPSGATSAVFLKEGQAIFAKRAIEPDKGKYDFPGGFVEYGEDVYDACVREVLEECQIKINRRDLQLITAYTGEYIAGVSVIDLIFIVRHWEGQFQAQDDVAALEWKPLSFMDDKNFARHYPGLKDKLLSL